QECLLRRIGWRMVCEEAQAMELRLLRLRRERQPDEPERDPQCGQKRVSSHCLPRGSGRSKTKVSHDSCSGTISSSGQGDLARGFLHGEAHQRRLARITVADKCRLYSETDRIAAWPRNDANGMDRRPHGDEPPPIGRTDATAQLEFEAAPQ